MDSWSVINAPRETDYSLVSEQKFNRNQQIMNESMNHIVENDNQYIATVLQSGLDSLTNHIRMDTKEFPMPMIVGMYCVREIFRV